MQPQLLAATTTAVAAFCDLTFRWIEAPNASLYRRLYCGLKGVRFLGDDDRRVS